MLSIEVLKKFVNRSKTHSAAICSEYQHFFAKSFADKTVGPFESILTPGVMTQRETFCLDVGNIPKIQVFLHLDLRHEQLRDIVRRNSRKNTLVVIISKNRTSFFSVERPYFSLIFTAHFFLAQGIRTVFLSIFAVGTFVS